ncbi:MAG: metallophosphoesterase [Clostridia bacterium]|nr:metallophosphoesterase [Clostridia bacterium]
MKMRWALLTGAVLSAGAAGAVYRENQKLTVANITVFHPEIPAAFDGWRFVHLSDLHSASFGKNQKRLLEVIDALHVDMALLTGDLFDRRRTLRVRDMKPTLTLFRELASRMPTVRVDGNHETRSPVGDRFRCEAAKTGVVDITGRVLPLKKGGEQIMLIGVPDVSAYADDDERFRERLHELKEEAGSGFSVTLSHRPQYLPDYVLEELPLVLCGHAHGGQVRLPFVGGLYAPEQGVLPRYTEGRYRVEHTQMIVSRGLGNSGFPVRVFNRPELGVITLKRGEWHEDHSGFGFPAPQRDL